MMCISCLIWKILGGLIISKLVSYVGGVVPLVIVDNFYTMKLKGLNSSFQVSISTTLYVQKLHKFDIQYTPLSDF